MLLLVFFFVCWSCFCCCFKQIHLINIKLQTLVLKGTSDDRLIQKFLNYALQNPFPDLLSVAGMGVIFVCRATFQRASQPLWVQISFVRLKGAAAKFNYIDWNSVKTSQVSLRVGMQPDGVTTVFTTKEILELGSAVSSLVLGLFIYPYNCIPK